MSGGQQALAGMGGDRLRLDAVTVSRAATAGATAQFRIDNDGQVYIADDSSGGVLTARYFWISNPANAALYDVRWATTAGTVDTTPGAESTNLNLGTDRTWQETNNAGVETCAFTASIHRAGDTANPLVTAAIGLEVDGS